jgi:AI-2 transport protein TqsA
VIIFGLKQAASIVTPVLLSLVVTIAISPLLSWQVRKGVNRSVAFMTTLIVTGVAGVLIVLLLMGSLAQFIRDLPSYADELQPYWDALMSGLQKIGIDTTDLASLENVDPQKVLSTGASLASGLVDTLSGISLMALTVLFMLMEASTISVKFKSGVAGGALRRMEEVTADMRSFIKVTAVMGAIVAILDTILLVIVGVPNALLWGFLSFFLSFIPFIGFVIAMIPPTIMALITGGWEAALIVLAGYLIMNTISDNIFKPRIMGSHTNLSALTVFLSVLLWGWVFGPIGGLLAVPVTLLAKRLVFEAYDEWKWFSVVIGDLPQQKKVKEHRTMLARIRPHMPHRK